ncbi:hypothetical protein P7C70_g6500, partial [Phenoliferia sp. Uapishka_3]
MPKRLRQINIRKGLSGFDFPKQLFLTLSQTKGRIWGVPIDARSAQEGPMNCFRTTYEQIYDERMAKTPSSGQSDIIGGARDWLGRHHPENPPDKQPPFTFMSTFLLTSGNLGEQWNAPISRLIHLARKKRNAIELQMLVACTLFTANEEDVLVEVALERLR